MTIDSFDQKWKKLKKELKSEVFGDAADDGADLISLIGDVRLKTFAHSASGQKTLAIIDDMMTTTISGFGLFDFQHFANKLGFSDEETRLMESHRDSPTKCMFLKLNKTDTKMAEILRALQDRKDIMYRLKETVQDYKRETENEIAEKFKLSVLVTYACDGRAAARRIALKCQSQAIGALLIEEHAHRLYGSPSAILSRWFRQVDYIIPVVTKGYLECIRPRKSSVPGEDPNYCRLIYSLMENEYLLNHALNKRVRPIRDARLRMSSNTLVRHPMLTLSIPSHHAESLVVMLSKANEKLRAQKQCE